MVDATAMSVAAARQPPYPVRVQQRRCGKCGKLVSRGAYACRRCGKAQRMHPRTILLIASGLLIGAMFAVAILTGTGASARPAEASVARLPGGAPPAHLMNGETPELSAAELWSAYSRDRLATDHLYRGRSMLVTGTVRSVDRNFEGDMVVRLATPDPLETVNATLATRTDPAVDALTKGRSVSLLCVARGALMGAPVLGSCFVR